MLTWTQPGFQAQLLFKRLGLAPDPDPHGLRLCGARIEGRLDLENITSTPANIRVQYFDQTAQPVGLGNSAAGLPSILVSKPTKLVESLVGIA